VGIVKGETTTLYGQQNKNRLTFALILIILLTTTLLTTSGEQTEPPAISFTWAIFYKTSDNSINTIDYEQNTIVLSQDNELKIFLQHGRDTYLYLFLHDAEGDLYLFYPTFFDDFDSPVKPEKSVYIPENLEWFGFEGTGREQFYLIASKERLTDLETYTETYQKAFYNRKSDEETVKEAKQKVIDEIRALRIDHFALINKAKGDVLLVAGEFRGLDKTLEFPAQHINAEVFYARTIRIEH